MRSAMSQTGKKIRLSEWMPKRRELFSDFWMEMQTWAYPFVLLALLFLLVLPQLQS